jgi:hypothetical protein
VRFTGTLTPGVRSPVGDVSACNVPEIAAC